MRRGSVMETSVVGDSAAARILDAAYTEFTRHGVRRTTMNQIADAAGLGIATVYRRFPQKSQLVRALILREADSISAAVDLAINAPGSSSEQAAGGFAAFARSVTERPLLVRLLRGDAQQDGAIVASADLIDQLVARGRDHIADWIRNLQAQGRYVEVDADIVGEIQARLAVSLVITPGRHIPMHDDGAAQAFARQYLVPVLGVELPPGEGLHV